MFVALVLPLTFANPSIPWVTALLGGIGAGLFIDEVGKFITQRNDSFFPLAFPIIYSFILVCVWFALRLHAFRRPDTRSQLYHVLEEVKQVLDNDLDPLEHAELRDRLAHVLRETDDAEERALAEALLGSTRIALSGWRQARRCSNRRGIAGGRWRSASRRSASYAASWWSASATPR